MASDAAPGLVGRTSEIEQLVDAFAMLRKDRIGRVIRIGGPMGVGTSRVIEEFRRQVARNGWQHRWWSGSCSRPSAVSFEPLAGLLRDTEGGVSSVLADAAATIREGSIYDVAVLGGMATRLREASRAMPLIAAVDSFDGADASTVKLFAALTSVIDDAAVMLLLGGRDCDALRSAPTVALDVRIDPMTDREIETIVRRAAVARPATQPRHRLSDSRIAHAVAAAGGRPDIAVALARADTVTPTLAAIVTDTAFGASSLITAIALAGNALNIDVLVDICACGSEVVDRLTARGIVHLDQDRLAHVDGAWEQAAREALGSGTNALATALGAELERVGAWSNAARTWERGGDLGAASRCWERAAAQAHTNRASATAAQWIRRSIELGGVPQLRAVGEAAAAWSLAAGDLAEADTIAASVVPILDRRSREARARLDLIRYRARLEQGITDANSFLDAALRTTTRTGMDADIEWERSGVRADALTLDALRLVLDDPQMALERANESTAIATRSHDDAMIAEAVAAAAVAHAMLGDLDAALAAFDDALQRAENSGDFVIESRIASNKVYVLWRAGRPADLLRAANDEIDRLAVRGVPWLGDQLGVATGVAHTLMGALDDAMGAIERTRAGHVSSEAAALLLALEAEIAILRGERTRATALLDELDRSPMANDTTVAAERALQRAEQALLGGDGDAASLIATAALAEMAVGDQLARLRLALVIARAGGDSAALGTEEPVGRECAAAAAEIVAWSDGTDISWAAASMAWAAVPAPIQAWRCDVRRAVACRDLDQLSGLRRKLDEMGTPGLRGWVDSMFVAAGGRLPVRRIDGPLTRRELDVLSLVSEGLTNREISQRLAISHRTVGVHVERCLMKLDVSTRGAAVHEAHRRGLFSA